MNNEHSDLLLHFATRFLKRPFMMSAIESDSKVTMVAVLSLALGIGANTALFSVVDAVLMKTLPVPEPERLVLFEWQAGRPFNVLRLVVWQGMRLVLFGLTAGVLTGYGLKRLLASQYFAEDAWQRQMAEQLYGVTVTDPLTLFVIATVLTLVALVACWLPARKAAQVDPLEALRYE